MRKFYQLMIILMFVISGFAAQGQQTFDAGKGSLAACPQMDEVHAR
jgi:hypothetical protein